MTKPEHAELGMQDRFKAAARQRLRAADRLRLEYIEAWYTPIGQRALQLTGGLALLNVIVFVTQLLL